MNNEQRILEEVEKTLHAFDDLPKLDPNPFLFTRVMARLSQAASGKERSLGTVLRLKPIAFAVIVVLNIITIIHVLGTDEGTSSRAQLIDALSQEYHSTDSTF